MVKSIANQEAIERFVRKVDNARQEFSREDNPQPQRARTSPRDHYSIAQSSRVSEDLIAWLGVRRDDPAFQVRCKRFLQRCTNLILQDFLPRLKDHLLARARGIAYDGDEHEFSEDDHYCVNIKDNLMYPHPLLRVNYTTYDLRREQDTVNPLTRPDIIVLSHEEERSHPYWYAHVIHIFHIMVQHRNNSTSPFSAPVHMDVLFVRWFRRDINYPSGWSEKRLLRLQFFDQENPSFAFGFLDPESVIRGVHLIPGFAFYRTNRLLGPSKARQLIDGEDPNDDWTYYYVNM